MFKAIIWGVSRKLIVLFLLAGALPLAAAGWLNHEIFSPPRRALQSYHLDRLEHPDLYGLSIRKYGCLQGKAPCLLIEPNARTGAGKRGSALRRQVSAKGIHLNHYGNIRGTVVLLHGRMGRKEDLLPVAERFVAAGFRCLIPDLPAHGDSPVTSMSFGSSTFEASLPRLIVEDARQHFQLPEEPTALWGMSMGGAFAVSAASESANFWDALLVVSSFASLDEILNRQIPPRWQRTIPVIQFYLGLAQRLQGKPTVNEMRPTEWAKHIHIPTLIVHGESDSFIPATQGKALYEAVDSSHKEWLTVPGGGHANVLATAMPLYAEMNSWLIRSLQRKELSSLH